MQRQCALHVAAVDELIHLAIGIACDIAQHGVLCRFLFEPVNRHDRKQLLDRPTVRHALEQGEVTEVRIRKGRVDAFQFLRDRNRARAPASGFFGRSPSKDFSAMQRWSERQISEAEQIERRIERLLRIVVSLRADFADSPSGRFPARSMSGCSGSPLQFLRDLFIAHAGYAENVKHQHAMIRGNGASALGHDDRMFHIRFVAHILDVVHDVVRILLQRVIHARFENRPAITIVIDAGGFARRHPDAEGRSRPRAADSA